MRWSSVKKVFAIALSAATIMSTMNQPLVAAAASTTATVSTQSKLDNALANAKIKTVLIKSTKKKSYKVKGENCGKKTLSVNTKNATIKNYTIFKTVKIAGDKNTYYEYAGNKSITLTASNTKLIAGNKTNIGTIQIKGKNDTLKVNKGTTVNKAVVNKKDTDVDLVINGNVTGMDIQNIRALELSGTTKKVTLQWNALGGEITSSVPIEATFKQNANVVLNQGAENSVITTTDETVITLTNYTNQDIKISTPKGDVLIKSGETKTSEVEENTTPDPDASDDQNGNGGSGGISDSGNENIIPADVLSKMELDLYEVTLSNEEKEVKPVNITTYNQYNAKMIYIKKNADVEVSLDHADLGEEERLSAEGVASNPGRYYTVNKSVVTFLSSGLPAGEYVYIIKVGTYTQSITITITGEDEVAARTILLPYSGNDSSKPIINSTIDAVVNTEEDGNKEVAFALYSRVGECDPKVMTVYNDAPATFKYKVFKEDGTILYDSDSISLTLGDALNLPVTSIQESRGGYRYVNKMEAGIYTVIISKQVEDRLVTYYNKLNIIDTQATPSLVQTKTTVSSKLDTLYIDSSDIYYNLAKVYNAHYVDNSNSVIDLGLTRNELENCIRALDANVRRAVVYQFYAQYGLMQSCEITYNGLTYGMYDERIKFIDKVNLETNIYTIEDETNLAKPFTTGQINSLTTYLDISHWNTSNGNSRLYVPFTFSQTNLIIHYPTSGMEEEILYTIDQKAVKFDELEQKNLYIPLNTNRGYSMYMKIIDNTSKEITNYSIYTVTSLNPEILQVASAIDTTTKSISLSPITAGTATVLLKYNDSEVARIQVYVGDLDASIYEAKTSKTDITLSNNSDIIDQDTITLQVVNKETQEVLADYVPQNDKASTKITLQSGVKVEGDALSEDEINTIQNYIDNDLYNGLEDNEENAAILYMKNGKLTMKGYTGGILPEGTYQFEISLSGIKTMLTVHITGVELEGDVTYSLVQDAIDVDLATCDFRKCFVNNKYNMKAVKMINGKAVGYVSDVQVTFTDPALEEFYSQDTKILDIYYMELQSSTEYEDYYTVKYAPVTEATYTVSFQDDCGTLQQLTGTIQITNSDPYGVKQTKTEIDSLSLEKIKNAYAVIWNTPDEIILDPDENLEEIITEVKNSIANYIVNDAFKVVGSMTNGATYKIKDFNYTYQYDETTGAITAITISNIRLTSYQTYVEGVVGDSKMKVMTCPAYQLSETYTIQIN